jgi:hypothetical protein
MFSLNDCSAGLAAKYLKLARLQPSPRRAFDEPAAETIQPYYQPDHTRCGKASPKQESGRSHSVQKNSGAKLQVIRPVYKTQRLNPSQLLRVGSFWNFLLGSFWNFLLPNLVAGFE